MSTEKLEATKEVIEGLKQVGRDRPEVGEVEFNAYPSDYFFIEEVTRRHGPPALRIYKPVEALLRELDEKVMDIYPAAGGPKPKNRKLVDAWARAQRLVSLKNTINDNWKSFLWPDIRSVLEQSLQDSGLIVLNPETTFQYLTDCWDIIFHGLGNGRSLPVSRVDRLIGDLDGFCSAARWRWPDQVPTLDQLLAHG